MNNFNPHAKKEARIAALKAEAAAKAASTQADKKDALATRTQLIKPEDAAERIRIIFDNSGSMGSSINDSFPGPRRMEEAKKGVVEYLRNCQLNRDAVTVHFLNSYNRWGIERGDQKLLSFLDKAELTTDLILLASSIDNPDIRAIGGTPLFEVTEQVLDATPVATRIIMFSDGEPNNTARKEFCIAQALEKKIPIDTVFIGSKDEDGAVLLQEIAERTHGIYIVIDSAKGADFKTAFKYLTPSKRLMLMDKSFKEKVERGEIR